MSQDYQLTALLKLNSTKKMFLKDFSRIIIVHSSYSAAYSDQVIYVLLQLLLARLYLSCLKVIIYFRKTLHCISLTSGLYISSCH